MSEELNPTSSQEEVFLVKLHTAWKEAQQLEEPPPDAFARARALFRENSALIAPRARIQPRWVPTRRASLYAFATVCVVFFLFIAAFGIVLGPAAEALPGQTLYPVKLQVEQVRLAATMSSAGKAELCMTFAQARVREAQALALKGDTRKIPAVLDAFDDLVQMGNAFLAVAAFNEPQRVLSLAPRLQEILRQSESTLAQIVPLAPLAQVDLLQAIEISNRVEHDVGSTLVTATQNSATQTPTPGGETGTPFYGESTEIPAGTPTVADNLDNTPIPTVMSGPTILPTPSETLTPANMPIPSITPTSSEIAGPTNTSTPAPSEAPGSDDTPTPTNSPPPTNPPPTNPPPPTNRPPTDPPPTDPPPTHPVKPSHTPKPTHTPKPHEQKQ